MKIQHRPISGRRLRDGLMEMRKMKFDIDSAPRLGSTLLLAGGVLAEPKKKMESSISPSTPSK